MNIAGRLRKIESQLSVKDKGEIILYNEYGKSVDAEIIRKPTPEAEGLAKLADGSEMPIIYEESWDYMFDCWIFDTDDGRFHFLDNRPADAKPLPSLEGKLFMRYSTCRIMTAIPATREMVEAMRAEDTE